MHIFMKALDYYRKPDVEFTEIEFPHGYDKEFFVDLFCKYYAITGNKDSLILSNPDFVDETLQRNECKEFLSLPSPRDYIIISVQVAERMIMKYKEEFKNKISLSDMKELDWELYHNCIFTDLEDRLTSFKYRRYKILSYLFHKLPETGMIHKLRKLLISEREEILYTRFHDELKSYEGRQFMKFLKMCNRLREAVRSENIYYTKYDEIFREIETRKVYIYDIVTEEEYDQFKDCVRVQDMFKCPTIGFQKKNWHIQEKPHLFCIRNKEAMKNAKSIKDKWEVWIDDDDRYHEGAGVFNIRYRDEWDYVNNKMHEGIRMCIDGECLFLYFSFLAVCSTLRQTVDLSNIWCHTPSKVFKLIEKYNVDITDVVSEIEWKKMKEFGQKWWSNVCPEVGKDTKLRQILHKTRRRFNIYFYRKKQRKHDIKWNNQVRREQRKKYKYSMRHIGK